MKYPSLLVQEINVGGQKITGPLVGINKPADVINKLIPIVMGFAVIILFFVLVWGGYSFMTSQGNPDKIKAARSKITTAIIGFVLLIFSYVVVRALSTIFGLGTGIF